MTAHRQNHFFLLVTLLLVAGSAAAMGLAQSAKVQSVSGLQEEATATPDAEGVIYSEVRPNDSLWAIAARAGITLEELLALNNISEDEIIQPGQQLIIGYGTPPATETSPALPTLTLPPPTPTRTAVPPPPTAICLVAFDDLNKDGIHDSDEPLKAAVAFTIFNEDSVIDNYVTDGVSEPYCLQNLTSGDYKVTRSFRPNEVLTNEGDWVITLHRGDVVHLEFGSYVSTDPLPVETRNRDAAPTVIAPLDQATPIGSGQATPPENTAPLPDDESGENGGLTTSFIIGAIFALLVLIGIALYLALKALQRGRSL